MPELLPEFVTIAEGARLLGVTARTIQRHATRLATGDRIEGNTSATDPRHRVLRVRLSALLERAGKSGTAEKAATETATPPRQVGDVSATHPEQEKASAKDALIEQLRAENVRMQEDKAQLWEALQREQETARRAVDELASARESFGREIAEVRRESSVMIAATAAGRIMPVSAPDAPETGDTVSVPLTTPPPVQETKTEVLGQETAAPVADYSAQNNSITELAAPRSWWHWLPFGKKKEG